MVVPNNHGFPTKNNQFGVFWGYHHLRKHPYIGTLVDIGQHRPNWVRQSIKLLHSKNLVSPSNPSNEADSSRSHPQISSNSSAALEDEKRLFKWALQKEQRWTFFYRV